MTVLDWTLVVLTVTWPASRMLPGAWEVLDSYVLKASVMGMRALLPGGQEGGQEGTRHPVAHPTEPPSIARMISKLDTWNVENPG